MPIRAVLTTFINFTGVNKLGLGDLGGGGKNTTSLPESSSAMMDRCRPIKALEIRKHRDILKSWDLDRERNNGKSRENKLWRSEKGMGKKVYIEARNLDFFRKLYIIVFL